MSLPAPRQEPTRLRCLVDDFRRKAGEHKWIRSCFSRNDMLNANGKMRLGELAREVFSKDPGRQLQWARRDPDARLGTAATTPTLILTVDPLLADGSRTAGRISTAACSIAPKIVG